jgi:hypothetical protein
MTLSLNLNGPLEGDKLKRGLEADDEREPIDDRRLVAFDFELINIVLLLSS